MSVPDGHAQDFILRELLVRRVCGHQLPQFSECTAYVLLPPALPAVGEDLAYYDAWCRVRVVGEKSR
jgi:hypothetical protein